MNKIELAERPHFVSVGQFGGRIFRLGDDRFFRDGERGLYLTIEDARKGVNKLLG